MTSIITFSPCESMTLSPTGPNFINFTNGFTLNPCSFFSIPQAGKITYFSLSYIPDSTGDFLTDGPDEAIITYVHKADYNFYTNCHDPFTQTEFFTGVVSSDLCVFPPYAGLYFENNDIKFKTLLVNKNDLISVNITFNGNKEITGKFSVSLNYTSNCHN